MTCVGTGWDPVSPAETTGDEQLHRRARCVGTWYEHGAPNGKRHHIPCDFKRPGALGDPDGDRVQLSHRAWKTPSMEKEQHMDSSDPSDPM